MSRTVSPTPRPTWRFSTKVLLPVGAITLLIASLGGLALFEAVRESDNIAVERQVQTARRAINTFIDGLLQQQRTVAVSDLIVTNLTKADADWQWINNWIGLWLHRNFGHDQVYILNARNEPVYAMADGVQVPNTNFHLVQRNLQHLVDDVRNPPKRPEYEYERDLAPLSAHQKAQRLHPATLAAMRICWKSWAAR